MNKLLSALLAVAAMTSPAAHAADAEKYYAGLALTTPGKATARSRTGELVTDKSSVGAKIYAGININDQFALEAGYGNFDKNTFKNTGAGTSGDAQVEADTVYMAAKGSYLVNDRLALFGKAGVAHTRISLDGFGDPDVSMTRPMLGLGVQYKITPTLALTLDLANYGSMKTGSNKHFNLNKLEAGLKVSF